MNFLQKQEVHDGLQLSYHVITSICRVMAKKVFFLIFLALAAILFSGEELF